MPLCFVLGARAHGVRLFCCTSVLKCSAGRARVMDVRYPRQVRPTATEMPQAQAGLAHVLLFVLSPLPGMSSPQSSSLGSRVSSPSSTDGHGDAVNPGRCGACAALRPAAATSNEPVRPKSESSPSSASARCPPQRPQRACVWTRTRPPRPPNPFDSHPKSLAPRRQSFQRTAGRGAGSRWAPASPIANSPPGASAALSCASQTVCLPDLLTRGCPSSARGCAAASRLALRPKTAAPPQRLSAREAKTSAACGRAVAAANSCPTAAPRAAAGNRV